METESGPKRRTASHVSANIDWLTEQPEDSLRELGATMKAYFDSNGRPGRRSGAAWWTGCMTLVEALRRQPAAPQVRADEVAAAIEDRGRRGQKAKCFHTNKIIFQSESEAKTRRGHGRKTDRIRTYRCEHCYGWHMTSRVG